MQEYATQLVIGTEVNAGMDGTGDRDWFSVTADAEPAYYRFDV